MANKYVYLFKEGNASMQSLPVPDRAPWSLS